MAARPRKAKAPVKAAKKPRQSTQGRQPSRFAHPFYTTDTPAHRFADAAGNHRMLDHIKQTLQPIPPLRGDGWMTLEEIIGTEGVQQISAAGALQFHTVGDTGKGADSAQGLVAEAMAKEYDISHPGNSPAFFVHLGDVIYGHDKMQLYRTEFYEPYVHYPGKILAIPGNHDGEVFGGSDAKTLAAFLANFCTAKAAIPKIAGSIYRETMTQPGPYWVLDAPFAHIVGLYSNAAENPGFIGGGAAGEAQRTWLAGVLRKIAAQRAKGTRKALVFATHHPPYSAGGHSGSTEMLADLDALCAKAGVQADLHLSGHAHSYQRYERRPGSGRVVPYLVVGTGGINDQAVPDATGQVSGQCTFVRSFKGYGYASVSITASEIAVTFNAVQPAQQGLDMARYPLA